MKALLVLLAKPQILDQLQEHYQSDAAEILESLMTFSECIDTDLTHAFLDMRMLSFKHNDEQQKTLLLKHYDFSRRNENKHGGFFSAYKTEREREEKAVAFFNEHFAK